MELFFIGIWHGLRAPFVFVINLFANSGWLMYKPEISGTWYNLGFLISLICIWGSFDDVFTIINKLKNHKKASEKK